MTAPPTTIIRAKTAGRMNTVDTWADSDGRTVTFGDVAGVESVTGSRVELVAGALGDGAAMGLEVP